MKKLLNQISIKIVVIIIVTITTPFFAKAATTEANYVLDETSSYYVTADTWDITPSGGDTIYISSERTKALKFQELSGDENNPIVVINKGGQVKIDSPTAWGGITFENCKYIKITGTGHSGFKYGFLLSASTCGLGFTELSSDCEAEFIKVSHEGFFGIYAKKDYGGNPPSPAPVFENLIIHDCFVENVTEGMYLGETKSPGMEFKHVKVYNNIVRNTGREAIQIANMVEDVEIYNNTLLNAGQDDETWQNNILQIGDNSVANVYNNILIGAPKAGIITMGMGNNIFSNNYISSCKGVFIDNRLFSEENYPIVFSGNYFVNNSGEEIIKNMNEINNIVINNNTYDTDIDFFTNASGVDSNLIFANNRFAELDTISFTSPDSNDYSLSEESPAIYANMGAPGGEEYFAYEQDTVAEDTITADTITSEQIILTSDMIVDLVDGGSVFSAAYLVDEQNYTPENGLHPTSESWKPYWNMNYGPYSIYIDLQEEYTVTNISLHDMTNIQNLEVSVGEPGSWEDLFTEPCDKYKTWKEHITNVKTRYIRLSMNESVYAAVNEIVIYGYKDSTSTSEKSASISTSTSSFSIEEEQKSNIELIKNPVSDNLRFNISEDSDASFSIEVFDINGSKILSKDFTNNFQSQELNISISEYNLKNGLYIIRYLNSNREQKTMKFVKTS